MAKTKMNRYLITVCVSLACLSGCLTRSPNNSDVKKVEADVSQFNNSSLFESKNAIQNTFSQSIVWAANLGGEAYKATNGIEFESLESIEGMRSGAVDTILGSQDSILYKTYLEGELDIDKPLPNGLYDVTFLFAEPTENDVGTRVFDVVVNDKIVLEQIDVRLLRDGKALSALDKTVHKVAVENGNLKIQLKSRTGQPVVSAIVIRDHSAPKNNWSLVWQDEFDYEGKPDPEKWSYNEWPARKVNDEDQVYTNREKNVRVEDGRLIIEAHKEQYGNGEYTSGRIHTLNKADMLYGKIDVRAKLPAGRGTWSAIWMLPSDPYKYSTTCQPNEDWQGSRTCDAWPNSGEIDIMEHVGYDMHNVHGTVHNKAYYWINWEQRKGAINAYPVDSEFQVYSVEWSPEHITVLMNDTPYFSYKNEQSGWQAWPFDHPYHLILNLAIGGVWGRAGGPIDDSIFPVKMEIDYVRFYTNS